MKPFLIVAILSTIISFLTILQFTWFSVLKAITFTIINGYFFICINSMWEMFRDEAMRGRYQENETIRGPNNRRYQPGTVLEKV